MHERDDRSFTMEFRTKLFFLDSFRERKNLIGIRNYVIDFII